MTRIVLLAFVALTLVGCDKRIATQMNDGTIELKFMDPVLTGANVAMQNLHQDALERCPNGYEKLSDRTEKDAANKTWFVWTVRCN
ncbi:hypothetical protein HH303_18885 [Rhodospirillaceae bacterium KN72]|uniref:Lipoprotein n=1 Tax=Pacificispira spongiicola TaxID=2729598 RepID=A0A7Y0E3I7_9PROT|nr:hypothetical protein [Pacificispira spongiicola]NMM46564.1 hypothetical protein [Pacificispira spongiicola]